MNKEYISMNGNRLFLYWFQKNGRKENFGDALNPYLLMKLTNYEIYYLPVTGSKVRRLILFLFGVTKQEFNIRYLKNIIQSIKVKNQFVCIGSVLEHISGKNCHVWGAGIINSQSKIREVNYHAVRGKKTQERLAELGFNVPKTIGDPALLLPLVYYPKIKKKYRLGIIPHFVHYEIIKNIVFSDNVFVVNVLDDVETVVKNIMSCEYTISSSLHGIIVSHAYKIPSLWCEVRGKELFGDNIKFYDYFSSVGINEYDAIEFFKNGSMESIETIIHTILKLCDIDSIYEKISSIQIELLKAAPFNLVQKYRDLIN